MRFTTLIATLLSFTSAVTAAPAAPAKDFFGQTNRNNPSSSSGSSPSSSSSSSSGSPSGSSSISPSSSSSISPSSSGISSSISSSTSNSSNRLSYCKLTSTFQPNCGGLQAPSTSPILFLIGHGQQIYKCAGPGATPVQYSAQATLLDVSCLVPFGMSNIDQLPGVFVNSNPKKITQFLVGLANQGLAVGEHTYEGGFPKWKLDKAKVEWHGKKVNAINSPVSGAITWVQLQKNTDFTANSIPASWVYRVETVAGTLPVGTTCTDTNDMYADYAAQYIFYA